MLRLEQNKFIFYFRAALTTEEKKLQKLKLNYVLLLIKHNGYYY